MFDSRATKYYPWGLAALALAILISGPLWMATYTKYLAALWMIFAISTIGLNIPMGLASTYTFGHGGFMLIGAYTIAIGTTKLGISLPFAFMLAIVISALIAFAIALPSLRLSGFSLGIVTFAFGSLLYSLVKSFPFTGGPQGIFLPKLSLVSMWNGWGLYYLTVLIFAFGALWAYSLSTGKTGRALRTLGESEIVARSLGIDVARLKVTGIILSGIYGAVSGALLALTTGYVGPDSYLPHLSVDLFAAVMIGGVGTTLGPVLGALFIVLIPELTQVAPNYGALIYSLLFLLIATLFPAGLMGVLKLLSGLGRERPKVEQG